MFMTNNIQCILVDFLEILATHVQYRFARTNGGSTNTTRFVFQAPLIITPYTLLENA